MRVLIAPDKFAGTLTAVEAAAAIAEGWASHAPEDEIDSAPMADGGPGFVDVIAEAVGGRLSALTVTGPLGAPVPATLLIAGEVAYVESAQACGVHLTPPDRAERATSAGVGDLIAAAVDAGCRRVVVGLGGTGTSDGGAGALRALGAWADGDLSGGVAGLATVTAVDLGPVVARLKGVELVAASDVDAPLAGLFGAAKTFGPQKGIAEDRVVAVDAALERFGTLIDKKLALAPGAGAAGGLGFALLAVGAGRTPGLELVAQLVDLPGRASRCDLVVTGEGAFDFSSRAGKVPAGVAAIAEAALRPCVVMAGEVLVGSREMRALGIESAYSLVELVGRERALGEPYAALSEVAARVARSWSR